MTKVKICGITNKDDAFWAASLGADFVGINLSRVSKRHVSIAMAGEIIAALPPFTIPVLVFVDEPAVVIARAVAKLRVRHIQLHGTETPQTCTEIRGVVPGGVLIKAVRVEQRRPADDTDRAAMAGLLIEQAAPYTSVVDHLLFDVRLEGEPGGTGVSFDWSVLAAARPRLEALGARSCFLAGGLTPDNVAEAIETVDPFAVDAASGVERLPRRKDFEKMKLFIRNAKG